MRLRSSPGFAGFSILEAAIAAAIVAIFFVALFGLNTQCLYFVNSSREMNTAGQAAQSRLDQLRNCTWTQITDRDYIKNSVLNAPVDNGTVNLGMVTEVVTVNKYAPGAPNVSPTPAPSPGIQVTRVSDENGGGTASYPSPTPATTIATADMVKVDLLLSWIVAPNSRPRSIALSTVYAKPAGTASVVSSGGGTTGKKKK